jgi:hypothetical protein
MIRNLLLRSIYQGTSINHSDQNDRRIIYANVVYVTLPVVYLSMVLVNIQSYLVPVTELQWDQFVLPFEIAICAFGILSNRVGFPVVGKIVFLVSWPLLMHVIPIWLQKTPSDYYFAFPAGIIFHSVMIQLMISPKTEKISFWFFVAANFILLLFSIDILRFFEDGSHAELMEMVSSPIYLLDCVQYWLLFAFGTFLLAGGLDLLFDKIADDQRIISEQQGQLEAMNEELTMSNESLNERNVEITGLNKGLEDIITKRTLKIEDQNRKLREYAFYNAHKLRGPFCRLKGLFQIQSINETERPIINGYMEASIADLENVISEIQVIVQDAVD